MTAQEILNINHAHRCGYLDGQVWYTYNTNGGIRNNTNGYRRNDPLDSVLPPGTLNDGCHYRGEEDLSVLANNDSFRAEQRLESFVLHAEDLVLARNDDGTYEIWSVTIPDE